MRLRMVLAIVVTLGGCGPASAPTYQGFATNACEAFTAMFRVIGNPDAGTDSEFVRALNETVRSGNEAQAGTLANEILAELERGRRSAAAASTWQPGAAAMFQLDRVLVAYEAMVTAKVGQAARDVTAQNAANAFGAAGGPAAWDAMMAAAQDVIAARPADLPPYECAAVPINW